MSTPPKPLGYYIQMPPPDFIPSGDDFPEPHADSQPSRTTWTVCDAVCLAILLGTLLMAVFEPLRVAVLQLIGRTL